METTKRTANIAEALKDLQNASQHVMEAMREQMGGIDGADKWMRETWQPKIEPAMQLVQKTLGEIVADNAGIAAAAGNNKWAI